MAEFLLLIMMALKPPTLYCNKMENQKVTLIRNVTVRGVKLARNVQMGQIVTQIAQKVDVINLINSSWGGYNSVG